MKVKPNVLSPETRRLLQEVYDLTEVENLLGDHLAMFGNDPQSPDVKLTRLALMGERQLKAANCLLAAGELVKAISAQPHEHFET